MILLSLFKSDNILESILVLVKSGDDIISANYESATLIDKMENTDLTTAQVVVIEAINAIHRGNVDIHTSGVLVLNPDEDIDKWIYDHRPEDAPNAIYLSVQSKEGRRYRCKQPLAHRPAMEGVLFCKRCAAIESEEE